MLILPQQLPIRERGREGEGEKGEEERRGGEKEEKKDKEWGTRGRRVRKGKIGSLQLSGANCYRMDKQQGPAA